MVNLVGGYVCTLTSNTSYNEYIKEDDQCNLASGIGGLTLRAIRRRARRHGYPAGPTSLQ